MTKKVYNQPVSEVSAITGMYLMQSVSAAGGGSGAGKVNTIPTDEQW